MFKMVISIFLIINGIYGASQMAIAVKNPPANAGRCKRQGFDRWVGKTP